MDKKEVIKAANTLKNYCNNCIDCDDCIFLYNYYFCKLTHNPHEWELPEAISDEVSDNDTNKRIAELHREVDIRDRYIKELKQAPYSPRIEEPYYYPDIEYKRVKIASWYGYAGDYALKKLGMIYKTKEESEKNFADDYKVLTGGGE